MTKKLVSEIITIKANNLDSYVSKYFDTHLQDKQNILSAFQKYKDFLKVDACIWALVVALDGKYFDELIIDEYTSYDVFRDLRFYIGSDAFEGIVSSECIIRIALSKESKCIYQISPFRVLDALFAANSTLEDDIIEAFKHIVKTQAYTNKLIFKNCNLTYIGEEANLLKSIFNSQKEITLSPVLLFCALHDIIYPGIYLENLKLDKNLIQTEINIILSDDIVRSNYLSIPGLLTSQFRYINHSTFDNNISFDEIIQSITSGSYFSCTANNLRTMILYIYNRYPNRMDELESALLSYIKNNEFYVEYDSILYLTLLEQAIRKFKNSQTFIDAIFDLPIAYALFCDFKKGKESFPKILRLVLRNYNVEFDYIVNLLSQIIDSANTEDFIQLQSFKNLYK